MRYPKATWKPLASNWASQPKLTRFDLVILHTAAGSMAGTYEHFRKDGYAGAESHFIVGHDGVVWQFQDTAHQAEANGAANSRAISIETADRGPGFSSWDINDGDAVPAWTTTQVNALVELISWCCTTHNIPKTLIPDSRSTRRGIGYHRLGVPGYAVSGGELWSSAQGKACPGPRRIAQIPGIIARLNKEEDIMATTAELRALLREEVATLAKRVDLGFARNQVLTAMGVGNAESAPASLPSDKLAPLATRKDLEELERKVDRVLVLLTGVLDTVLDDEEA